VETAGAGRIVQADPSSLARALVEMLSDPHALHVMGERGRALARRYEWDDISDQLVEVYEEGLDRWRSAHQTVRRTQAERRWSRAV
jgi:glycosyltransferase involved in cell wall biosynthesis